MPGPDMERIKSRMTELLEVFSKEYTRAYKVALIADRREKANGPAKRPNGEPEWKLLVDPSKLVRNPQMEGCVYVGDGLSKKVFWSMNNKYVVVEKSAEAAAASSASSPKSPASPAPADEEKEADSRVWLDDSCSKVCMNPNCGKKFGLTTRRSHCRHCGELFCGDCVKFKIKDDKFCEPCFKKRSVAGSPEAQLPPLKEPKNKSKVYNFYNYRIDRLDKTAKEACGKYAVKLSHRREKKPQPIIGFETEKERDQWYNFLYMAHWHAPSPITDDKLLRRAFTVAFQEFRWHAYVWSAWMMDGTESELISETLYECLERDIFGNDLRALGDMPKKMARNAIEGTFEAGVGTMWSTLQKSIATIRPDLEKAADGLLGPVFDAEQTIKASAKGSVEAPVNAGLEAAESQLQEQFGSHLPNLQAAGCEQLKVIREIFVNVITKLEAGEKFDAIHHTMRWEGCFTTDYQQKPVTAHLEEMKKSNLSEVKWLAPELIYGLRDLQQSVFYVMKTELGLMTDVREKDAQVAKLRASAADIVTRATADVQAMLQWKLVQALDRTIRSPLMTKVSPVVQEVSKPLAASVPAPVKDIVDPKRTCNEIVNETIEANENALIQKALAPTQQAIQAEGERLAGEQI